MQNMLSVKLYISNMCQYDRGLYVTNNSGQRLKLQCSMLMCLLHTNDHVSVTGEDGIKSKLGSVMVLWAAFSING